METDGVHYHFVTRENSSRRLSMDIFSSSLKFSDNYYGTSRAAINPISAEAASASWT